MSDTTAASAPVIDPLRALGDAIAAALPDAAIKASVSRGELTLTCDAAHLPAVITFLRDNPAGQFINFIDLCGVDYPARDKRFDVIVLDCAPTDRKSVV